MSPASETDIYHAIKEAIIRQQLRPNMQLVEDVIAESFGVSRTPVRNVFRRLAREKLVNVIPYKGTFVSCPSVDEAKEVFEMRKVLEATIVRKACKTMMPSQAAQLRSILAEERAALANQDVWAALQVSGEFHIRLAEISGNSLLKRYLEELVSLTYVIISFYGDRGSACCNDHESIVGAIERAEEAEAERLMTRHLQELEASLHFENHGNLSQSLMDVFKPYHAKS